MTRYAPLWLQSGSYGAGVDRRLIGALWPAARCDGGAVTATGVGMGLQAAPGYCAIPAANATGSVLCAWDAPETVSPPLDPAPPAGTNRIDLVICQARGADLDGGSNNDFVITYVKGAEAASPVAPATPPGALALAQVRVNGGVASIAPADITDRRPASLAVPAPPLASAPRGYTGSAIGPATQINIGGTATNVVSLTASVVAGRRYRLSLFAFGQQLTAQGTSWFTLATANNIDSIQGRFAQLFNLPINAYLVGSAVFMYSPAASGSQTWTIQGLAAAGTLQVNANNCVIILEDMGSQ
jgi:hypothetical protein